MHLSQILCKSILSKSGIGGVDFAINPYIGCEHGCIYCYAKFMCKYTGHIEPWGSFVDVKINAVEVLARELKKAWQKEIFIGSVTDAYQPVEKEYKLTRKILELLSRIKTSVYIQTKSDLICRDLDVLKTLSEIEVCWTIITLDETERHLLEPGATPIQNRLKALENFSSAGIKTAVFIGPLMPFMTEERVTELLTAVVNRGARKIFIDRLNYASSYASNLRLALMNRYPEFARNITAPYTAYYDRITNLAEHFCRQHKIQFVNCI
ncbi:MAG: radical SAM protein [Candidatus Sumerlaeia bacterium]|nr:radical SAM protein [Candidatus Sumerlaeia bacterium]